MGRFKSYSKPRNSSSSSFSCIKRKDRLNFKEHKVSSIEYSLVSQYGTHVDSPYHFYEDGRQLHEIGIEEMSYPICVIDVTDKG